MDTKGDMPTEAEWCAQKAGKLWIASEHATLEKARMDSTWNLQREYGFGNALILDFRSPGL